MKGWDAIRRRGEILGILLAFVIGVALLLVFSIFEAYIPRRQGSTNTTTNLEKVCVVVLITVLVLLLLHYWLGTGTIFGGG